MTHCKATPCGDVRRGVGRVFRWLRGEERAIFFLREMDPQKNLLLHTHTHTHITWTVCARKIYDGASKARDWTREFERTPSPPHHLVRYASGVPRPPRCVHGDGRRFESLDEFSNRIRACRAATHGPCEMAKKGGSICFANKKKSG